MAEPYLQAKPTGDKLESREHVEGDGVRADNAAEIADDGLREWRQSHASEDGIRDRKSSFAKESDEFSDSRRSKSARPKEGIS
jgi:hypothetical protein